MSLVTFNSPLMTQNTNSPTTNPTLGILDTLMQYWIQKTNNTASKSPTQEELFWKKKAGDKVISNYERNTTYFHAKVKENRRQAISKLSLSHNPGDWTDNLTLIHNATISHFEKLLTSKSYNIEDLISLIPNILSNSQNISLIQPLPLKKCRKQFLTCPR